MLHPLIWVTASITGAILMVGQILQTPAASQLRQGSWQLIEEKNGMRIFAQDVPGSAYKAFKGTMTIEASLQRAINLLTDPSKCPALYSKCMRAEVIKSISGHQSYVYAVYDAPWPYKNRDVVSYSVVPQDNDDNQFILRYIGKPNYLPKKNKFIRIPKLSTTWKIKEKQKQKIHVVYKVFYEPGGNVIPYLAHLRKKQAIVETLSNMKRLLTASPDGHEN